jgi:hypothetical protein
MSDGTFRCYLCRKYKWRKLSNIESLLKEKEEREIYANNVVDLLATTYTFIDKKTAVARTCATAGHIYSFLSLKLNEKVNWKFQRKIKNLLIKKNLIKVVYSGGIKWFVGIAALDDDLETADQITKQNIIDRKNHRIRQREYASRRKY